MATSQHRRWRDWSQLRTLLRLVALLETLALIGLGALTITALTESEEDRAMAYQVIDDRLAPVCGATGVADAGRPQGSQQRRAWYSGMPTAAAEGPTDLTGYDTVVCLAVATVADSNCEYTDPDKPGMIRYYERSTFHINAVVRDARSGREIGTFFVESSAECLDSLRPNQAVPTSEPNWDQVRAVAETGGHLDP